MDIRINELRSQVQTTDSQALLDPRVLRQIIRSCVQAVKEELAREKRMNEQSRLTSGKSEEEN